MVQCSTPSGHTNHFIVMGISVTTPYDGVNLPFLVARIIRVFQRISDGQILVGRQVIQ
jgi:hypothetical protein